jgi:enoyl-CoA hydratase/carnithine racemase
MSTSTSTEPRTFEYLEVTKRDSVLEVWLNRPDKRNALTTAMEEEWDDALELAASDEDIKVVTLQGRGKVFSAGADMKEFAATYAGESEPSAPSDSGQLIRPPTPRGPKRRLWPPPAVKEPALPRAWYCRKTLIAGVHGFVGPLAMRMLAPFDFIIAAEGTRFSWEQARMGNQNTPLGILAYQLPMRVIKQLLLLGGWFDAEAAKDMYLVQRVVAAAELPREVERWAESASALTVPTISAYKEGIHRMYELAGLVNIVGVGNNLNPHEDPTSRGHDFHGALHDSGLKEALALRDQGIDNSITEIRAGSDER